MKKLISEKFALNSLLLILSLFVIFHLLVIAGIIPFEIVWGVRIKDQSELITFETISIAINLLMLAVVAIKSGLLKVNVHSTIIHVALWIMLLIFLANTLGNLLSTNPFEKTVFAPFTILLFIFTLRTVISKDNK